MPLRRFLFVLLRLSCILLPIPPPVADSKDLDSLIASAVRMDDSYGVEERRHSSRGFSLFRKKQRPEQSVFEAAREAENAYPDSPGTANLAPRQGSKGRWSLLARRNSGSAKQQGANVLELQKDVEFFRGECLRQGQELQELQYRLKGQEARASDLQQRMNLERFKYELLVDLWAMRVLDNEELGTRAGGSQGAQVAASGQ